MRFTFPQGTVLQPGDVAVVFGGGDVRKFHVPGGAQLFVAEGGLALTNSGDTVTLADSYGNVVDEMTYGSEGGKDRSLTRAEDGNPDSPFVQHPGRGMSPGTKQDGSPF